MKAWWAEIYISSFFIVSIFWYLEVPLLSGKGSRLVAKMIVLFSSPENGPKQRSKYRVHPCGTLPHYVDCMWLRNRRRINSLWSDWIGSEPNRSVFSAERNASALAPAEKHSALKKVERLGSIRIRRKIICNWSAETPPASLGTRTRVQKKIRLKCVHERGSGSLDLFLRVSFNSS